MGSNVVWAAVAVLLLTGCLDRRYESLPDSPAVAESALVGRWVDESGAALVLNADKTAESTGVECPADRDPKSGKGTWRTEPNTGPSTGAGAPGGLPVGGDLVVVVEAGCAYRFGVAGTAEEFRLYYYRGDLDARDAYLLDKAP